jgi:hypothetical protein
MAWSRREIIANVTCTSARDPPVFDQVPRALQDVPLAPLHVDLEHQDRLVREDFVELE